METTRWGILGTGRIAQAFADDLRFAPGAELSAVGSRAAATAQAFGERFRIPHRHASYEALVQDPQVDVVYVATPHNLHEPAARLALQAGKPVLCEKPFTLNAAEARGLINLARQRQIFLMEAMWTRFLPAAARLRELLAEGWIGDACLLAADFGTRFDPEADRRQFAAELGGGALLDLGVYPVSLASMVFGPPETIVSLGVVGPTGVDEVGGVLLRYPHGQMACLYTSLRLDTPTEAHLIGTQGRIRIHAPMFRPTGLSLIREGTNEEIVDCPILGTGLHHEAAEVMRCLQAGQLESPVMPLDESRSIMETLDAIRVQWGLKYPRE